MKVEIINKPMLCWDQDEDKTVECHVLAKVTGCNLLYPFKAVSNEDTTDRPEGWTMYFRNAKPIPEEVEMTVAEISKALGKKIKIIE